MSQLPSPPIRRALAYRYSMRAATVVLAHALAAQLAVTLTPSLASTAWVWPAAGLGLAALVRWGTPQVPAVLLGALLVAWSALGAFWPAVAIGVGNSAASWLAAAWLRDHGFDRRLPQRRDVCLLLTAGFFGCALLAAANGTLWLAVSGRLPWPAFSAAWLDGWAVGALALALGGVPLMSWQRADVQHGFAASRWRETSGVVLAGALAVVAAFTRAPSDATASAWLLVPPVLVCWLTMRAGIALASSALLALALVLLTATAHGSGPFATLVHGGTWLRAYLCAAAALALLPHAVVHPLAQREQRWRRALEGFDVGVSEWNLRTGHQDATRQWRAWLPGLHGAAVDSVDDLLARVHADDRAPLLAKLQAGAGAARKDRHEVRLQVNGEWQWFDLHLEVLERDVAGAPMRVLAALADIGERRSAQDRQELSSNLFMHLHEGLLITDAQMRVLDVNPTYTRITGVPRDEQLGQTPSVLRDDRIDLQGRAQLPGMWAELRANGHWAGEVIDRRRNGDACALLVTVSAVHGPDGELRYHVLVVSDITEQRLQRDRLARQAHYDELTRLPNRARLSQLLTDSMRAADADGHLLAVCCLDIDHFKTINEQFGHAAGDRLLAELAIRLRGAVRSRGSLHQDSAGRLGGDEFALVVHAGSLDEARAAVERVLRLIAEPLAVAADGPSRSVTASVGVTVYPLDGSDADTLLRHADNAMYGAKQAGRNGYLFFDAEHRRRNEELVLAIGRVQQALDGGELMLYYQPKVDLRRGVVLGCEALLRWNHPAEGVLGPARFLPLIEHTGLSARIGDHVLALALDQLDAWHAQGLELSVSVNISSRHLQQHDFVERLAELLSRHPRQLGPYLELEVLETAAIADIGYTSALLERCARLGVRWALDDFGTGYSTLTYLKRLPVQMLKIDRSFVQNMLTDAQDRAIVEGVIGLAHTFDCTVVAEGVETPAQARMLLDIGCQIGQGEGIAAPMPAEQVVDWIAHWRGPFVLAAANAARNRSAG